MNRQRVEESVDTYLGDTRLRGNAGEVWDHIQNARIELEDIVMNNISSRVLAPWQRFAFWLMYELCQYMHDKNAQIIHDAIEAAKSREEARCQ